MKNSIVLIIVAALVLITAGLWIFTGSGKIQPVEVVNFGVIIILVTLALFIGYKRFSSLRRKEPAEDEMSKKVLKSASSISYYISIYLWLVIMYFSDRIHYETHTIIGAGILGMAIIFAICWLVFNFMGVRNE